MKPHTLQDINLASGQSKSFNDFILFWNLQIVWEKWTQRFQRQIHPVQWTDVLDDNHKCIAFVNFLDIGVKSANMHLILPLGSAGKNVAPSYKLAVNIFTELYVGSQQNCQKHTLFPFTALLLHSAHQCNVFQGIIILKMAICWLWAIPWSKIGETVTNHVGCGWQFCVYIKSRKSWTKSMNKNTLLSVAVEIPSNTK